MSNKSYQKLDNSDAALRMSTPVGMEDGVKQLILRHCGFEFYNTRPYHNYETWSDGYIIMGRKDGKATSIKWLLEQKDIPFKERDEQFVSVSAEDLDEAAVLFAKKIGQEEKVLKHINATLNIGTHRGMSLRKKFRSD